MSSLAGTALSCEEVEYVLRALGVNAIPAHVTTGDLRTALSLLRQEAKGGGPPMSDRLLRLDDEVVAAAQEAEPNMKGRLKVALTHDVDFITSQSPERYAVRRLRRVLSGFGPIGVGVRAALGSVVRVITDLPRHERYCDLADWLRAEADLGVRSTFFFLPYEDEFPHILDGDYRYSDRITFDGCRITVAEAIRAIAHAGWEIGLHGTIRSATVPGLLARQKADLEAIIKQPVESVRQHYLSYVPAITPRLMSDAGFLYDSSHGLNRGWGFPSATTRAYPLWDIGTHSATKVTELPMTMMDTARGLPKAGVQTRFAHVRVGVDLMTEALRRAGIVVMNWHPHYWPNGTCRDVFFDLVREARRLRATVAPLREVGRSFLAEEGLSGR